MIPARLAVSKDFMESYSRLPRGIQKKVREFTEKFQKDPTQSGLNFERLDGARDPKVRSVRIDQAYRAIVVHPPRGDVFLCVWVDHHDEAYRWAQHRQFEVNPRSGSFQIFDVEDRDDVLAASTESAQPAESPQRHLFEDTDDEDLLLAGVPEPLLVSVRALVTEADLDALAPHLPSDASEMLYLLAAGFSLIEAIEESDRPKPVPAEIDAQDFEAALARPESQQSFQVVSDEAQLEAMLDAPLQQWRTFLHPSQRKLVQMNANGPVRVLGGAGTGKTVVLMHRAQHLGSKVFTGANDRILVTTFTRNLALDLRANLEHLCDKETFGRLDVMNLHAWAAAFMRKQGHAFRIAKDHQGREILDQAISEGGSDDHSREFYRDEWDQVVQAQNVRTRDDYLTARRVGRGTRLSKRQRAQAWEVFARYRELLDADGWIEWPDAVRETRLFIEKQGLSLPYRAVLSDEVQDFSLNELELLRTIAPQEPNTLFLVGDGHQRIYGRPVSLSSAGIEIRGRSRRLKLNYRTTEEIRRRAVNLLEGRAIDDLDGGADTQKGYRSLRAGQAPKVQTFDTEAQEAAAILDQVRRWLDDGKPEGICIAARTRHAVKDRYLRILEGAGIHATIIDTDSDESEPGVRLATMHRMKGLEFPRVLIAGVQEGQIPRPLPDGEGPDPEHDLRERCLLYVAMTRARDELLVTGYGRASSLLDS